MVTIKNLFENKNIRVLEERDGIMILEHVKDLSVQPETAVNAYYASEMNVRKRQALITLNHNAYTISAGAMQWTAGNVKTSADVKGIGDFFKKSVKGAVTNESAVKPRYEGSGYLMLEPTYRYLFIEEVSDWGQGVVLEDGLFLACESNLEQKVIARANFSSAALGNEGLFNLSLKGKGLAILESPVPKEELIELEVHDDEVRIDGSYAVAWSSSLEFKVEKSTKSLLGSAVSGEGFVNVYRGSGRILMAPVK